MFCLRAALDHVFPGANPIIVDVTGDEEGEEEEEEKEEE